MATVKTFGILILYYLSICSGIVPLWIGIKKIDIIWIYVLVSLCSDVGSTIMGSYNISIRWEGNVFLIVEYTLLTLFYRKYILRANSFIDLVLSLWPISFLLWPFLQHRSLSEQINFQGGAFFAGVFALYAIVGYYRLLHDQLIIQLETSPAFWLHTAVIIYSCGSALLFLFAKYLHEHYPEYDTLCKTYFLTLNIVKHALLGRYFYLTSRRNY